MLQSDSVLHIHVFIIFQILSHLVVTFSMSKFLCYMIGPYWLSLHKCSSVHANPKLPNYPFIPLKSCAFQEDMVKRKNSK